MAGKRKKVAAAPRSTSQQSQKRSNNFTSYLRGFFSGRKQQTSQEGVSQYFYKHWIGSLFGILGIIVALLVINGIFSLQHNVCQLTYTPNAGTLKYVTVSLPKQSSIWSNLFSASDKPQAESNLKTAAKTPYLFTIQGQSLRIVSNNLNLTSVDGQDVIITGQTSPCGHTVTLDTLRNVTIIPHTTPTPAQITPQE